MRLEQLTPEAVHERGQLGFGAPRAIRVARDGRRIAFLRSPGPLSAEQELWLLKRDDHGSWTECRIDEPSADAVGVESAAAAAMRERMRELASGILDFTADADLRVLVFSAVGALWRWDGTLARLEGADGAEAPLLSPDGSHLAYLADRALHV